MLHRRWVELEGESVVRVFGKKGLETSCDSLQSDGESFLGEKQTFLFLDKALVRVYF